MGGSGSKEPDSAKHVATASKASPAAAKVEKPVKTIESLAVRRAIGVSCHGPAVVLQVFLLFFLHHYCKKFVIFCRNPVLVVTVLYQARMLCSTVSRIKTNGMDDVANWFALTHPNRVGRFKWASKRPSLSSQSIYARCGYF